MSNYKESTSIYGKAKKPYFNLQLISIMLDFLLINLKIISFFYIYKEQPLFFDLKFIFDLLVNLDALLYIIKQNLFKIKRCHLLSIAIISCNKNEKDSLITRYLSY